MGFPARGQGPQRARGTTVVRRSVPEMFGWPVMTMIVSVSLTVSLSGEAIETDAKLVTTLATIGTELGRRAGAR